MKKYISLLALLLAGAGLAGAQQPSVVQQTEALASYIDQQQSQKWLQAYLARYEAQQQTPYAALTSTDQARIRHELQRQARVADAYLQQSIVYGQRIPTEEDRLMHRPLEPFVYWGPLQEEIRSFSQNYTHFKAALLRSPADTQELSRIYRSLARQLNTIEQLAEQDGVDAKSRQQAQQIRRIIDHLYPVSYSPYPQTLAQLGVYLQTAHAFPLSDGTAFTAYERAYHPVPQDTRNNPLHIYRRSQRTDQTEQARHLWQQTFLDLTRDMTDEAYQQLIQQAQQY